MGLVRDKKTRVNIYFMAPFVLVAIIFAGLNVYKNIHYSTFRLVVEGKPVLKYVSTGGNKTSLKIAPDILNGRGETFNYLHTFWWADRSPGYVLDEDLWFHVSPTMTGHFILTSAHIDAAHVLIQTKNEQGHLVQSLIPNKRYEIQQFGQWYTVKFQWG